jgi:hypothetical protein
MTNQQINMAIAEACGWTEIHDSGVWHHHKLWGYPPLASGAGGNSYQYIRDYCNDLNAMHEALKTLPPDQLWDVAYSLPMETMLGFMATARELAETFLMVIGKWKPTTEESSAVHLRDAAKMMKEVQG